MEEAILYRKPKRHIIHLIILKNKKYRYLCNQACNITMDKSTTKWETVTCMNCLCHKDKMSPDGRKE